MGWATQIRADAQVDYRLAEQCGCDLEHDAQVDYRLGEPRDLRWIGSGLAEVGITPGTAVDKDAARALMAGLDPRTGEVLVAPKQALDPRGKLAARPLVDAIAAVAAAAGRAPADVLGAPALAARYGRAERGLVRDGEAHLLPVGDAERLAAAAGLDLAGLYPEEDLARARRHAGQKITVGVRGTDVVLDLPKSVSVLYGLAGDVELAAAIEDSFLAATEEAVAALEGWTAYGMAGHHGDGQRAERVDTSGFLGWVTLHRGARPVGGEPGDPHLHVHVNIANMAKGSDGKWRTVAAGGRDLHRHAHVVNELAEARLRTLLSQRLGVTWERSETTGAWEITGIPEQVRATLSRRHAQITEEAGEGATRDQQKTAGRRTAEAKEEAVTTDVRAAWLERVLAEHRRLDVAAMVAEAAPGWHGPGGPAAPAGPDAGPQVPSPEEIAAQVWEGEHGLVASRKAVARTDVMAAVLAACPEGITSAADAEALTDAVLAVPGHAVRLPDGGQMHQANRQRFTHLSVVGAEADIIEAATAGLDAGLARLTPAAAEMALSAAEAAQGFTFGAEQRAVVERLLTAGHGVEAVIGVAGAGKTTLMNAARAGWEAAGLTVAGASTAAVAAANLSAEAGIGSRTIAAWTREIDGGTGAGLRGVDVLVIDEAAMVDDRALAALLRHAAATGTKVVGIGDPLQLRAVGVGGGFQRVHDLVGGLVLTENRRQRDVIERAALATWREGARTTALAQLAAHGRVHATAGAADALTEMTAAWNDRRQRWAGDVHGLIDGLLLLAPRRADVATLNAAARAARRAAGELGRERTWALPGGDRLTLAAGDVVRVTRNDYRSRRTGEPDVLNGFRGVVTAVDDRQGVRVEWRRPAGGGGHHTEAAWISHRQILAGQLTLGYASTVASAQGLTCDVALAYGLHADAHTLYPALSRAREETHLWLPLEELEDAETRARLGPARTEQQVLDRAVAAAGRALESDRPDGMVSDELTAPARPEVPVVPRQPAPGRDAAEELRAAAANATSPTIERRQEHGQDQEFEQRSAARSEALARAREQLHNERQEQREQTDAAVAIAPWYERPYGGVPTHALASRAAAADAEADRAEELAQEQQEKARELADVLGTDQAPAARRVAAVADGIEQIAHHGAAAVWCEAELERQLETLELYRTRVRQIDHRLALKRSLLFGERRELREGRDWLADQIDRRTAAAGELRQAADDHQQRARSLMADLPTPMRPAHPHTADPVAVAAAAREQLPDHRQRAEARDARTLRSHQRSAAEAAGTAARLRRAAAGYRAEDAARRALGAADPARHAAEARERALAQQLAARQRAEQARQQAAAAYQHQPPSAGRQGPSRSI